MRLANGIIGVGLCLLATPVLAQNDTEPDPPSRVGHLSHIRGEVAFKAAAVQDWVAAIPNRPLTEGDALWVNDEARAEMHIGSMALRFDEQTGARLLTLDDRVVQLGLSDGQAVIRIRSLGPDDVVELALPNAAVQLKSAGRYIVSFDERRSIAQVTVRSGQASIVANGNAFDVSEGQKASIRGDDELSYDITLAGAVSQFEDWAKVRDQREDNVAALQYVPREMTGYNTLDDYGSWSTTEAYGAIWYPQSVEATWAPYRDGNWSYIAPWGWTWIDDQPWGFAPFHYGRWVHYRARWGWCPGRVVARPVYAPALVAWVGTPSVDVQINVAAVGWFPLGPHEPYLPYYTASPRYVRQVNINHASNINVTNVRYRNRSVGYTIVPQETLVYARPVMRSMVVAPARRPDAPIVRTLSIAPRRESLVRAAPARPPSAMGQTFSRSLVTMRPPARVMAPIPDAQPRQPPVRPAYLSGPAPQPARANLPPPRTLRSPAPASGRPSRASPAPPSQAPAAQPNRTAPSYDSPGRPPAQAQPNRGSPPPSSPTPGRSTPSQLSPRQTAPRPSAPPRPTTPQAQPQRSAPAHPPPQTTPSPRAAPPPPAPSTPAAPRRSSPSAPNAPAAPPRR